MKIVYSALAICLAAANGWALPIASSAEKAKAAELRNVSISELNNLGITVPEVGAQEAVSAQSSETTGTPDLQRAKFELELALASLFELKKKPENQNIETQAKLDNLGFNITLALREIDKALAQAGTTVKLDEFIEEARFLYKILFSFLGDKDVWGYHLRQGPIDIEVGGGAIYDKLSQKVPFLRGAVGGRIRINPRSLSN